MRVAVGDPAPELDLRDQHGATFSLSGRRGRAPTAVVFYPFAFSSVCSGELAALQHRLVDLERAAPGAAVVAVSCDPVYSLRAFADRDGLTFPLLSDFWPHGQAARAFGAFDHDRGCAERASFAVDEQGLVRWSVRSPMRDARDVEGLVAALREAR